MMLLNLLNGITIKNKNKMKKLVFYTEQEEKELKEAIDENVKISVYAKENAERFGRNPQTLAAKMFALKKDRRSKAVLKFTHEQEIILKHSLLRGDNTSEASKRYAKQWGMTPKSVSMKLRWLKGNIDTIFAKEEKIEEGIQLPEGFLFEGIPSKVVIFKDHFRIYF